MMQSVRGEKKGERKRKGDNSKGGRKGERKGGREEDENPNLRRLRPSPE